MSRLFGEVRAARVGRDWNRQEEPPAGFTDLVMLEVGEGSTDPHRDPLCIIPAVLQVAEASIMTLSKQ